MRIAWEESWSPQQARHPAFYLPRKYISKSLRFSKHGHPAMHVVSRTWERNCGLLQHFSRRTKTEFNLSFSNAFRMGYIFAYLFAGGCFIHWLLECLLIFLFVINEPNDGTLWFVAVSCYSSSRMSMIRSLMLGKRIAIRFMASFLE